MTDKIKVGPTPHQPFYRHPTRYCSPPACARPRYVGYEHGIWFELQHDNELLSPLHTPWRHPLVPRLDAQLPRRHGRRLHWALSSCHLRQMACRWTCHGRKGLEREVSPDIHLVLLFLPLVWSVGTLTFCPHLYKQRTACCDGKTRSVQGIGQSKARGSSPCPKSPFPPWWSPCPTVQPISGPRAWCSSYRPNSAYLRAHVSSHVRFPELPSLIDGG